METDVKVKKLEEIKTDKLIDEEHGMSVGKYFDF